MIIRVFRARLRPGKRQEYERLCRRSALPYMRAQSGCLSARYWPASEAHPEIFVVTSLWQDLASLKAFAGANWQTAAIVPGEADLMDEAVVEHYDESYGSLVAMWHATADAVRRREVLATTRPLSEAQWQRLHPLLPRANREGRPRADDRRTLDGILYVLRTGCRWGDLPPRYGSPVTCWRRFARWEADGTWERVWRALFAGLPARERLAWTNAFVDSRNVPTKAGRRRAAGVATGVPIGVAVRG